MAHQSDSSEQRGVEALMLDAASQHLGARLTPQRVHLPGGTYVDVDGVAKDRSAFVEAFAHQGTLKGGQIHKIQGDVLKLAMLGRSYPSARLALVLGDPVVVARVSAGWLGEAVSTFGVEVVLAELDDDVRGSLLAAQSRQVMVNPTIDEDMGPLA